MEPASIVALCGSCFGIAIRAGKLGYDINVLRNRFNTAETQLQFLRIQVSAVKTTTETLARWLDGQQPSADESLRIQLSDTLEACEQLLGLIEEHVFKATHSQQKLGFRSKTKYLWNENSLNGYKDMLQTQVQVLQLILQCLQL